MNESSHQYNVAVYCPLPQLLNYEFRSGLQRGASGPVFILWFLAEPARLYYGFSGNLQEKVSQEGLVVSRDSLLSAYDKFCTNKQFSVFALLSAGATDVSISAYDYLSADTLRGLSDLLSGAHLPGGSGGWVDHAGLSGKPP